MVDKNGEMVGEYNRNNQYIRSKKQDEYLKRKRKNKHDFDDFNDKVGKFIWSYPEKIQELIKSEDFNKSDITMVFYLSTYVNGTEYLSFENRNKLVKKDIQDVLSIGRNRFSKFYNNLIDYGILLKKGKFYMWNPSYNFYGSTKGKASPTMLVRTYIDQVRYLYEKRKENGRKKYSPTALYPVFALVPYLHYSSNIVCKNPNVKHIDDIIYYNMTEIAELLDLKESKYMSRSLSSILLDGQTVFRSVTSKNETYLQLNPSIFWRDSVAPSKQLVSEFNMMDKNRKLRSKKK